MLLSPAIRIPSALYSASVPSSAVFFRVNFSVVINPPRTIASLAFRSNIVIAAIRSRAVVTGSSIKVPSFF